MAKLAIRGACFHVIISESLIHTNVHCHEKTYLKTAANFFNLFVLSISLMTLLFYQFHIHKSVEMFYTEV